jgi:hypothetical protein
MATHKHLLEGMVIHTAVKLLYCTCVHACAHVVFFARAYAGGKPWHAQTVRRNLLTAAAWVY